MERNKMRTHVAAFESNQLGKRLMSLSMQNVVAPSRKMLWAGRIVNALTTLFLLFDAVVKLLRLAPAIEGTVRLGYPVAVVVPIGLTLLLCVVLYVIPRTSVLGAILITGYLGGATATQVRVEDPWFLFPVGLGVLVWLGLFLRDDRLRGLSLGDVHWRSNDY
jgi:DoxX-like family